MWICPACGARFVVRNLAHSCVRRSADEFFADKPASGVDIARRLIAAVEEIGPVTLHAVKTRIALMVDVRFAAIYRVGDGVVRGHLWLKRLHATQRFERVERLGKSDFLYHFEVSARRPLDAELRRFLRRAYANGVRKQSVARQRGRRARSGRRLRRPPPR